MNVTICIPKKVNARGKSIEFDKSGTVATVKFSIGGVGAGSNDEGSSSAWALGPECVTAGKNGSTLNLQFGMGGTRSVIFYSFFLYLYCFAFASFVHLFYTRTHNPPPIPLVEHFRPLYF